MIIDIDDIEDRALEPLACLPEEISISEKPGHPVAADNPVLLTPSFSEDNQPLILLLPPGQRHKVRTSLPTPTLLIPSEAHPTISEVPPTPSETPILPGTPSLVPRDEGPSSLDLLLEVISTIPSLDPPDSSIRPLPPSVCTSSATPDLLEDFH